MSLVFVAVAIALACSDPVEPDPRPGWQLLPGILLHNGIPAVMQVPDSVALGQNFSVAFVTFGTGCDEAGETTSTIMGSAIEIMPVDWRQIDPPPSCPDSIVSVFPRAVDVRVDVTGPARVRVHGRREPGGTSVVFAATVQVR
jgi:hypothetical protein